MTRIAFLDCRFGAAGDMLLAACLDAVRMCPRVCMLVYVCVGCVVGEVGKWKARSIHPRLGR